MLMFACLLLFKTLVKLGESESELAFQFHAKSSQTFKAIKMADHFPKLPKTFKQGRNLAPSGGN